MEDHMYTVKVRLNHMQVNDQQIRSLLSIKKSLCCATKYCNHTTSSFYGLTATRLWDVCSMHLLLLCCIALYTNPSCHGLLFCHQIECVNNYGSAEASRSASTLFIHLRPFVVHKDFACVPFCSSSAAVLSVLYLFALYIIGLVTSTFNH